MRERDRREPTRHAVEAGPPSRVPLREQVTSKRKRR
jgi:hypothetical protein